MSSPEDRERVVPRLLEDEMRESFIDYSMSVIVQRALPDVRDGLKPVHRRILYAMSELGLSPNRPYKKSASVVGEVLGKYHPHGDSAVYDSLVRMVQSFSLRYPLVDGQGNFGSIDGDNAAAYRYTEAKLTRLATEMLSDIDKNTVDFSPNFDDRLEEPRVLPAQVPNLLVNGSSGIAVGMATNIPPHNLHEVIDACVHLVDNPDADIADLMEFIEGPDFPTAGFIYGRAGIREAYETGRGRVIMRARADIDEMPNGKPRIIISEIPFMVNKSRLIEQIAGLVREKRVDGITDLRDESDRDGMRIVVELRRDSIPQIILNHLFKHTQMQSTFGVILLALVDGVPRVMNLKEVIGHFLDHRHTVVVRRSEFELEKALEREHILEGLKIAVDAIDDVVELIRASDDTAHANERLRERFGLTERQAKAILDMRLARLTGLEIEKLEEELGTVRAEIAELREILGSEERRYQIMKDELLEIADRYGDERRTEIVAGSSDLSEEDLIAEEDMVITVSHQGYIKRLPVDTFRSQRRGGRGLQGMNTKDEDWVEHLFRASTHDHLMFFTRSGHCYWLKVYQIPPAGRNARGKPIVNLLALRPDEQIAALVPVREYSEDRNLLFATRNGVVKKTTLSAYQHIRVVGVNAINIAPDDELIDVQVTSGKDEVILATRDGMAIRFHESDAREMGRATTGVRGINLDEGDHVVGMVVVRRDGAGDLAEGGGVSDLGEAVSEVDVAPESVADVVEGDGAKPASVGEPTLLVVTDNGQGKRSRIPDYRLQRRGGKGVINFRVTDATGKVVAVKAVRPDHELMLITRKGVVNRQSVHEIRVIGRATKGVRVMNLDKGDRVVDVARLVPEEDEEAELEASAAVGSEGEGENAGEEIASTAEAGSGEEESNT